MRLAKLALAGLLCLLLSVPCLAKPGGGGFSGGGGARPSFGGGSSFKPSSGGGGSSKPVFGGGSSNQSSAKPSFGGGGSSGAKTVKTTTSELISGKTPISVSKKPVAESFDKLSGESARKAESRAAYHKSDAPAESFKTPAGKEIKIDPHDKQTDYLRGRLDESHWQTRYDRSGSFYGGYASRPVVVYSDFYHPMWNYWLLSQSLDTIAMWTYCHQASMDRARLDAMYAQNADLKARVAALEKSGTPRDPTYTTKGVDADLMYADGYVDAVYNPQPKTTDEYQYGEDETPTWIIILAVLLVVFLIIIIIGAIASGDSCAGILLALEILSCVSDC